MIPDISSEMITRLFYDEIKEEIIKFEVIAATWRECEMEMCTDGPSY